MCTVASTTERVGFLELRVFVDLAGGSSDLSLNMCVRSNWLACLFVAHVCPQTCTCLSPLNATAGLGCVTVHVFLL